MTFLGGELQRPRWRKRCPAKHAEPFYSHTYLLDKSSNLFTAKDHAPGDSMFNQFFNRAKLSNWLIDFAHGEYDAGMKLLGRIDYTAGEHITSL